jgi:outer membrane PBP1 activator LpoA protein
MMASILSCRAALRVLFVVLAGLALAACETTGSGPTAQAAKPPEPPMTHTRAAEICWMATEKGHADMNLDKRADVVDKCIQEKMKAAQAAPKS